MPGDNYEKLLRLISDERFVEFESFTERPNLFRIVGRTHTETWHSMFLGWLLDPQGSHGLGDFALRRLLLAVTNPDIKATEGYDPGLVARIASLGQLMNASVVPNERYQKELRRQENRFDVFVSNIKYDDGINCVLLIEQKHDTKIEKQQCRRYADWLYKEYKGSARILLMLAHDDSLLVTPEETMGDPRWNAISYQTLHDIVLAPSLRSSSLRDSTAPLLRHYIDSLRVYQEGRKFAVTDEEKKLALALFEAHKEAFLAIATAIKSENDELDIILKTEDKLPLRLEINGKKIEGKAVPEFYKNILKYIHTSNTRAKLDIPFATGSKRFLIAEEAIHPNGNPFRVPIWSEDETLVMEAHKSRAQALKDAKKLFVDAKMTVGAEKKPKSKG